MRFLLPVYLLLFLDLFSFAGHAQTSDPLAVDTMNYTMADTSHAQALMKEVDLLRKRGEYQIALDKADSAKVIFEQLLGEESLLLAKALTLTGICKKMLGVFEESIIDYKRTLTIQEKILEPNHKYVGLAYYHVGNGFYSIGDHDSALNHYQKAVEIWEIAYGISHPVVAIALFGTAKTYYQKGDYDKAIHIFEEVLTIRKKRLREGHPDIAESYESIGGALYAKGDFNRAIEYIQEGLHLRVRGIRPLKYIFRTGKKEVTLRA